METSVADDSNLSEGEEAPFTPPVVISKPSASAASLNPKAYVLRVRPDIAEMKDNDRKTEPVNFTKMWDVKLRELPIAFFDKSIKGIDENASLPVSKVFFDNIDGACTYSVEGWLQFKVGEVTVKLSYELDSRSGRFKVSNSVGNVEAASGLAKRLEGFLNDKDIGGKLRDIVESHFFEKIPLSCIKVPSNVPKNEVEATRFIMAMRMGTVVVHNSRSPEEPPVVIR